jgi:hypothetical protein
MSESKFVATVCNRQKRKKAQAMELDERRDFSFFLRLQIDGSIDCCCDQTSLSTVSQVDVEWDHRYRDGRSIKEFDAQDAFFWFGIR